MLLHSGFILTIFIFVTTCGFVAGHPQILFPQLTAIPLLPGKLPPAIIAVEVMNAGGASTLYPVAAYVAGTTIEVSGGDTVRFWTAFLNVTDLPALVGLSIVGLDLLTYPVGHPYRPRPCKRPIPVASPSGVEADVGCLEFTMPPGDGDGTQDEALPAYAGLFAASSSAICVVTAPVGMVKCWGPDLGSGNFSVWKEAGNLGPSRQVAVVGKSFFALSLSGGRVSSWGLQGSNPALSATSVPLDLLPARYVTAGKYGNDLVCVIFAETGYLRCWGTIQFMLEEPISFVSLGWNVGLCLLTQTGLAECFEVSVELGKFTYVSWMPEPYTLPPVSSISAGFHSVCVIYASDSSVQCWSRSSCTGPKCSMSGPKGLRAAAISVGRGTACAIEKGSRKAVCWMMPETEAFDGRVDPPPGLPPLVYVHADDGGACGVTAATQVPLSSGGRIVCWGNTVIGNAKLVDLMKYEPVPSHPPLLHVALSDTGICATAAATGQLSCWDTLLYQREGDSSMLPPYSTALLSAVDYSKATSFLASTILLPAGSLTNMSQPTTWDWDAQREVRLGADSPPVFAAAAQGQALCVIFRSNRTVACASNMTSCSSGICVGTVPRAVPRAASVAVGGSHACIVAIGTGMVHCWGDNADGQSDVPADLAPSAVIACGARFSCSLAAGSGAVRCWGNMTETIPASMGPAVMLAASLSFACAVTASDGSAVCWGGKKPLPPFPAPAHALWCGDTRCTILDGNLSAYSHDDGFVPPQFPPTLYDEESRHSVAFLRSRDWSLSLCSPSHTGGQVPACDIMPGSIRYRRGNVDAALLSPQGDDAFSLSIHVSNLGSAPPVQATGPTLYTATVCNWAPNVPERCAHPDARLSECILPRRYASDIVVCTLSRTRGFGGLGTVQLTGAGVDLGATTWANAGRPALMSMHLPENRAGMVNVLGVASEMHNMSIDSLSPWNATARAYGMTVNASLPAVASGMLIVVRGTLLWDGNATAPSPVAHAFTHPSCLYLPSLGARVHQPDTGCTCNAGAEDFPGEGEVPPSFIRAWNDTVIIFEVPSGITGVRSLAVCVFGLLASLPPSLSSAIVVNHPLLTSLSLDGAAQGQQRVQIRMSGPALQLAAPPGPRRDYLETSLQLHVATGEQEYMYAEPVPYSRLVTGAGWPSSQLHILVGPRCFTSVDTRTASVMESGGVGDGCGDWRGWRASYDAKDGGATFVTDWFLPAVVLQADVVITVLDACGAVLAVNGLAESGTYQRLPILQPELNEISTQGLTDKLSFLILRGIRLKTEAELDTAMQTGWLSSEVSIRTSILLVPRTTGDVSFNKFSNATVVCYDALAVAGAGGATDLTCYLKPGTVVGWYAVQVTIAGTAVDTAAVSQFLLGCSPGHWGGIGEACLPCNGASFGEGSVTCAGGTHDPLPTRGWHMLNTSESLSVCPRSRLHPSGRKVCVVPCEPPQACLGKNFCSAGYEDAPPGWRCSACAHGYYRSNAGTCEGCPESIANGLVIALLLVVPVMAGLYVLHKAGYELMVLGLLVDFWQTVSLVTAPTSRGQSGALLPQALRPVADFAAILSLNFNVMSLDCWISGLPSPLVLHFAVILSIPVLMLFILSTVYVCLWGCVRWKERRATWRSGPGASIGNEREQDDAFEVGTASFTKPLLAGLDTDILLRMSPLLRVSLRALQFMYFIIVSTVLSAWNCAPSNPPDPDGAQYMSAMPYEQCNSSNPAGLQNRLTAVSSVAFVLYVVGIPVAVALLYWRHGADMEVIQRMRIEQQPPSWEGHPRLYVLHKLTAPLFANYRPGFHWYYLWSLGRKTILCVMWLIFNKAVTLQLVGVQLSLMVGLLLSAWTTPLLSLPRELGKRNATLTKLERLLSNRNSLEAGFLAAAGCIVGFVALWHNMAPGTQEAIYYPSASDGVAAATFAITVLAVVAGAGALVTDARLQARAAPHLRAGNTGSGGERDMGRGGALSVRSARTKHLAAAQCEGKAGAFGVNPLHTAPADYPPPLAQVSTPYLS